MIRRRPKEFGDVLGHVARTFTGGMVAIYSFGLYIRRSKTQNTYIGDTCHSDKNDMR